MEKILAFNLDEKKLNSLFKICSQMKIGVINIEQSQMQLPISQLLDLKCYKGTTTSSNFQISLVTPSSLILMCDLSEKHFNKLLASLRLGNISIDYKAVLTPTNKEWNAIRLFAEMALEKKSFESN